MRTIATLTLVTCSLALPPAQGQQAASNAPVDSNQKSTPATPPSPNTLLDGTPIKLRLSETISSANAKPEQEVPFEVVEDVKLQGVVVIAKGATALGTVTEADHKKSMGRGGKLNINIDSVRLVDQEKAALRATAGGKGGGHVGAMTGAMVATSIVFFPAAPLFLFIHGKDITLAKGLETTAFIDGDMALNMQAFAPSDASASTVASAAPAQSQLLVEASVPNCDIDVDGAFAGNTPSHLSVAPGKHDISVHKAGYAAWTRTINASGTEVHVYAELVSEPPKAAPQQ